MDSRGNRGVPDRQVKGTLSFSIGVVERVKILKSIATSGHDGYTVTLLTGRPGISKRSQEGTDPTRVKLGRNGSSNGCGSNENEGSKPP
jgi:hypothetical protein